MPQEKRPRCSQKAINPPCEATTCEDWDRAFHALRTNIGRRVSPRDLRPLLKAGADEKKVLTLLTLAAIDSDRHLSGIMEKSRSLRRLANELVSAANNAARVVNEFGCDGRFWLAVEGLMSWDFVPKPGAIEENAIQQIRALAELVKSRGEALVVLSRNLKKINRATSIRDLLAYVWYSTRRGDGFDTEIAYLLTTAHDVAGCKRLFTSDQIKKFRQRHLPTREVLDAIHRAGAEGYVHQQKSFGQRIAGI
jgi:hypothetical protein